MFLPSQLHLAFEEVNNIVEYRLIVWMKCKLLMNFDNSWCIWSNLRSKFKMYALGTCTMYVLNAEHTICIIFPKGWGLWLFVQFSDPVDNFSAEFFIELNFANIWTWKYLTRVALQLHKDLRLQSSPSFPLDFSQNITIVQFFFLIVSI